jgi:acylglycerol lipase
MASAPTPSSSPAVAPAHGLLWRAASHLPLIGSLLWVMDDKHSCGAAPVDPAAPSVATSLGPRLFRSSTTGLLVHWRLWTPPAAPAAAAAAARPRGVVYLLHGMGEHVGRYEHVGAALSAAGFAVAGLDHQGCGLSEGDRSYVERFDHYVADAVQLAEVVYPRPPPSSGVPSFLLGHSMGGLMALHVAHASARGAWAGVVLSGPALVIDPAVDTPLNRFGARALSGLLPKLEFQPIDTSTLCSDAGQVRAYERDPAVYHGKIRIRLGYEVMNAIDRVKTWAADLSAPLFIVHGADDVLCGKAGSEWLMGAATGVPDKALRLYPGLKHEIFNEPAGPDVIRDVVAWLEAHLGGGARGGAAEAAE